ncbi:carbohydrate kinase [Thalassotalea fonticola]|uniref:Carbohydrate kinase n=1 Tax=Thalassotalea fonticola TaxID=3065649 RepID=A0ABZ0GTJ7_9GAMM|nr:carbohydrate kinase [Colwelliaceae bacterium S1-1]
MFSLMSYGEVVVDFLPNNTDLSSYSPMAGGAPANVAVAYARLGGESYFSGGISTDNFGKFLRHSLEEEGVKLDYVQNIESANTALVLVSLDSEGERSFTFYRNDTADTKYATTQIDSINWQDIDIFHFCSNTLTSDEMHENTIFAVENAREQNSIISFDVNLRPQLWADLEQLPSRVEHLINHSDLIKLSKEEAVYLAEQYKLTYQQYIERLLSLKVKLIIVTNGADKVHLVSQTFSSYVEVPVIKAVDTTAAGDSFLAGFIYSLTQQSEFNSLQATLFDLDKIISATLFAAKCGAHTCQQKGAFSALPRLDEV